MKGYQINYQSKMPTYNYWAITLGEPKPLQQSTVGRIGISFITHQQLKGKLVRLSLSLFPFQFHSIN